MNRARHLHWTRSLVRFDLGSFKKSGEVCDASPRVVNCVLEIDQVFSAFEQLFGAHATRHSHEFQSHLPEQTPERTELIAERKALHFVQTAPSLCLGSSSQQNNLSFGGQSITT